MRLGEHPYRKKFVATIIGTVSIDDPYFEGTYLLKIEPGAAEKLSVDHILFRPEFYDFHRTFMKRRDVVRESKELGKPSLDTFLLNPILANDGLGGRVYATHRRDLIQARAFRKNEFCARLRHHYSTQVCLDDTLMHNHDYRLVMGD